MNSIKGNLVNKLKKYQFLFEELVKRDFKKKYKRTIFGMYWSLLSPLFMLAVMAIIFGNFFGNDIPHYTIYLFSGLIVFNYYTESTNEGMQALMGNAHIFSKVNVPKYLFLISKNISSLINFLIILCIYFVFVIADGIVPTWKFLLLLYPFFCLIIINLGIGLILSALFIFFRDIRYLYDIIVRVVMYGSAIFYSVDKLSWDIQRFFYGNPIYVVINYVRKIVLYDQIPGLWLHLLLALYAFLFFSIGIIIYKKYNYKFIYYI